MATLKDTAKAYVPQQTKNIAELKRVSVSTEVFSDKGKDKDGMEFTYNYIVVDGERYRIPGVVIGDIKGLLSEMPNLKEVKVMKSGTGLTTKYQVVPLLEQTPA